MSIETKFWNDFSQGWVPNDDAINGRRNGLLQMDNLELDRNGSLSLVNGCTVKQTIGSSNAHTLFSRFLQSVRHDYTSLVSGTVFRDSTNLTNSGATTRTGFSTAFDYTLITSGSFRVKDSGTGTPVNLGIMTPAGAPGITQLIYKSPKIISAATDVNAFHGTGGGITNVGGFDFLTTWWVDAVDFLFVFATYDSANTRDTTILTQTNFGSTTTTSDDNDFFLFNPFTIDGFGAPDSVGIALNDVTSIQLIIYLVAPASLSPTIQNSTDYYVYNWNSDVGVNGDDVRLVSGASIILAPRRAQFTRVGNDTTKSWKTVVGYAIAIKTVGAMSGYAGMNLPQIFQGGHAGQLTGDIQYAQMNIAATSSYTAKSTLSPIGTGTGFVSSGAAILAETPTDPQVTDVWIFRRQGGLAEWYRVLTIPIANVATRQIDLSSNDDAITLGIRVNLNLVSTASTGVSDPILEIIGPISGRWYYFTSKFLYPSDINDPDLTDVSIGIRTCGSQSEVFLWAKKISEAVVLIGTSNDVYILTGTFTTLPDGSVDIYYRPLGCKYPPISVDAAVFSGSVYYLSDSGWTSVTPSGSNQILCSPNTDLLYHGETRYGYSPAGIANHVPGTINFPVIIAKSKLWCVITGTTRIEVYDFIRQYWHPVEYGSLQISAICTTPDGQILGYCSDNKLRTIDDETTKLIDSVTSRNISILSTAQDGGSPRNRKDLSTFKSRIFSNSSNCAVSLITDHGTFSLGNVNSSILNSEVFKDVSQILETCKWWQFQLTGNFSDFLLQDCSVDFDLRPTPVTYVNGKNNNFQSGSKKRLRVWPFVIDTRGLDVTLTPVVDGINGTPVTVNTSDKRTYLYQFLTDVFGIDYGYTLLNQTGTFEFWGELHPEIVQTLPIAKRFDQIGPQELFRYGKVQKLDFRILSFGPGVQSNIPYKIYFDDVVLLSDNLSVVNNQEGAYTIGLPKGTAGAIFRMELGPTTFDFHRFNIRILVNTSGQSTEGTWISLG